MALNLSINAPPALVMAALSTPEGLSAWWVHTCAFHRGVYYFAFANGEKGQAKALEISRLHFALELLQAPVPWRGVRLRWELAALRGHTHVTLHHTGDIDPHSLLDALKRFCES